MQNSKMYNVEVKFEGQEDNVIMGIEGMSEDDVYNFIPCVIPPNVNYELINITLDETTTPDIERKKQSKEQEMKAKYQEKYNEFVQICENMSDLEKKEGMAIVLDETKQEFFICNLSQAKQVESPDMKIIVAAEPKTDEEIAKEKAIEEADERINKGEATDQDIELMADFLAEYSESLDSK